MGLSLEHIDCSLSGQLILSDISFSVETGEFVSLLGKSGAGKSTTLKVIAGLIAQDSGHVVIGDRQADRTPAYRRNVSIVFQDVRLFPNLNVEENVAFPLRMQKIGRSKRLERVHELLEAVQLEGLGKRRCDEISGGQQQRVALARALAGGPDVLLLDEPFSGLDEELREDMRSLVLSLHRQLGTTTIQVTHDATEALMMSDRIIYLSCGRVVQIATPGELFRNPATAEVAACTGGCSTLHGTVRGGRFEASGLSFATDAADGPSVAVLRYSTLRETDDATFEVLSSQYAGERWIDKLVVGAQELTVMSTSGHDIGSRIGLSVDEDTAFVFSEEA